MVHSFRVLLASVLLASPIEQAASRVADCLNVERRQHFATSEVVWLLRQARIAGHHETMAYLATVAGY